MRKRVFLLGFCIISALLSNAQILPQKHLDSTLILKYDSVSFFSNKKIDIKFQKQIKTALLFYPELRNLKITFKVKKNISPLAARPTIWAIFQKPANRHYLILISNQTIKQLRPILLKNLSFNAQVGVLGHELSHIAEFNQKKSGYFFKLLLWQLSKKRMDIFENNTDRRTIEHGLGYQLLAWSREVRLNLNIKENAHRSNNTIQKPERYMSPKTIIELINY